jgi:hypothetical protein
VATYVPAVIYGIPASSPLHYVTYVRIYDSTAQTVDIGYTAGYVGSHVTVDYVVVFGSGWYYRPWVGYYWYGYPYTWGYGFGAFYTWWYPWGPPRYAASRPYPCYRPWWGPWVVARHGWTSPVASPHGSHSVKHPRGVTRIYDRWSPKVVAHNAGFVPRPDRVGQQRPLRSGEGYIVKDGRRFDIAPPHTGQQRRSWRDDDRSRLPAIQGTHSRPGQRGSTPRTDRDIRAPAADAKTSPPSRLGALDLQPRQGSFSQSVPRRDSRAGSPEVRAVPERRNSPGVFRQDNSSRRFEAPGTSREARNPTSPPAARHAMPDNRRGAEPSAPRQLRERDVRPREPGVGREWAMRPGREQGRADAPQPPMRRPQASLPGSERGAEPRVRREWGGPQRESREAPQPQMRREAREAPRPQQGAPRGEGLRQWRDRG